MKSLITALLVLLLVSACGQPDPAALRAARLKSLIVETFDTGTAVLRYNPATCECPPLEVRTAGGWLRVEVLESSDPTTTVESFLAGCRADHEAGSRKTYSLPLSLEEARPGRCPNGTPYFMVAIESSE